VPIATAESINRRIAEARYQTETRRCHRSHELPKPCGGRVVTHDLKIGFRTSAVDPGWRRGRMPGFDEADAVGNREAVEFHQEPALGHSLRSGRALSGGHMNHSDGTGGVADFVKKNRNIENTKIVLWHVFGLHHQVRPEDFPVQPCIFTGFKLMPSGFFDGNPGIDLAPDKNNASCHARAAEQ
jgi:hypothetical protein